MNFNELSNHLDNELGIVYNRVLINGKWGIGKSHFIQDYLKNKESIYISLFGLTSIEEVYNITLAQLIDEPQKLSYKALKIINKFNTNVPLTIPLPVLSGISLNVPKINIDIKKQIQKRLRSKQDFLYFVIDDIERKSAQIDIEDILGFIEKLSKNFDKIKIIIISNEDEIIRKSEIENNSDINTETELHDSKKYLQFKEKVIDKTYNIDGPSNVAVEKIVDKYVGELFEKQDREKYKNDTKKIIINFIAGIDYSNLRTLIKGLNFLKLINNEIRLDKISNFERKYLIKECLAIPFEDIDQIELSKINQSVSELDNTNKNEYLYSSFYEEKKEFSSRILSYLGEPSIGSDQINIINCLYNIYRDKDFNANINILKKQLRNIKIFKVKNQEERLFSKSEEDVEISINSFIDSSIKKVNHNYDIATWLTDFNNIYFFSKVLGDENIIDKYKAELEESVEAYINMTENLDSVDSEIYFYLHDDDNIKDEKLIHFITKVNEKIKYTKYEKLIMDVSKNNIEFRDQIETFNKLFEIYDAINFEGKRKLVGQIEDKKFFLPNLNGHISESDWFIASSIFKNASEKKFSKSESFQNIVKEAYNNYDKMGKYRIASLLKKNNICIDSEK